MHCHYASRVAGNRISITHLILESRHGTKTGAKKGRQFSTEILRHTPFYLPLKGPQEGHITGLYNARQSVKNLGH